MIGYARDMAALIALSDRVVRRAAMRALDGDVTSLALIVADRARELNELPRRVAAKWASRLERHEHPGLVDEMVVVSGRVPTLSEMRTFLTAVR